MASEGRILTKPQFKMLKRIAKTGEARLPFAAERNVARRLEALDCVKWGTEFWWNITDHGYNVLDSQREFFEEPHQ